MLFKFLNTFSEKIRAPFALKLPNKREIQFGEHLGNPAFEIIVHNQNGLNAIKSGRELNICEAYMYQDISLNGRVDMMKLLEITQIFSKEHPIYAWLAKLYNLFQNQIQINKKSIAKHYEFDHDFYLYFLDKTRAYSHGIFLNDEESLENANTRKLEFAMTSCQMVPGSKVLDIGSGWGSAVEYLGLRGMAVDGITISNHSKQFISKLIQEKGLNQCSIRKIDFLELKPSKSKPYDAIVSLGSLEHLPNYQDVLTKCSRLLRKGGYAYFDASAKDRHQTLNSSFIEKHIFPGNHQCLDIYAFLNAVAESDFDLICVHNDTHNYYLTLKTWAENLDKHQEEIVKRWTASLYRKFQLYLWGCCYGMANNELQAYRIVLRKKSV